ncbi:hypothetical protein BGZ95_009617 [Linnemannia exigua]|uniref:Uncharacterized protein n=1 Tax=Linnemannia exigua TaxID=604196 RepID=A0AAD4DEP8_9FUNG|nr:hypothetical protein BGZ95_009617 [Linnemannia exigua]
MKHQRNQFRSKNAIKFVIKYHILCRPAQKALLELLKTLPLPEDTESGDDFETALCHQLICANKPVLLNATDLNGKNPTIISLDVSHCDTIQDRRWSLGRGHDRVLARGYKGYPRFDFMLELIFIQVSVSDFGTHNTDSAHLSKTFDIRDANGRNQIEHYLNELYGPGHPAKIEDNRFAVARNDVPLSGFRVVYIRGSPGKPSHRDLVKKFPDVWHISFEELRETLFKNVV